MGQTLLLMPDLSKMQVKVRIPESAVHRIKPGLAARVALQDQTLDGQVASVASVTAPTSRWTGGIVTYDTIIKLPSIKRLMPGMSAEVEVIIARYEDVLTIPVAAVVETAEGDFCWVKAADGAQRRSLALGDSNDAFTIVNAGLKEGDEVMLNPLAFMDEAQRAVLKPRDEPKQPKPESPESGNTAKIAK
jgi:HlyD family secretion protein